MTKRKNSRKKSMVPVDNEPRKDIPRLPQNEEFSNPLFKRNYYTEESSSSSYTSNAHDEAVTKAKLNGCLRLIPLAVGLFYLWFIVLPNDTGFFYYLRKNSEPTTLNFYRQVCGALHDYDLIIAAVVMLLVCWFLLKRGVLVMKGAEDPSQDKIATGLLTLLVFIFGVCLLPRTFYMTLFRINHSSAKPVSREEVAIIEADTETPMFSHKAHYYFVLDVDKGNQYKVYAKREAYERYQKDSVRTVTVEWSKGVLGYRFISRFWMSKTKRNVSQHTKSRLGIPEFYQQLRVKKDGTWYSLRVRLRSFKMKPEMRREIAQGLFGVENDDLEQAYRTYLESFEEVDSSGLVSQDYPLIDISLVGQEFVDEKKQVNIYAEKSFSQDGSDYDFLYDKTFALSPE